VFLEEKFTDLAHSKTTILRCQFLCMNRAFIRIYARMSSCVRVFCYKLDQLIIIIISIIIEEGGNLHVHSRTGCIRQTGGAEIAKSTNYDGVLLRRDYNAPVC